jgi:hypothetical protein
MVNVTPNAPSDSIDAIGSVREVQEDAVAGSLIRSKVNFTSSAVSG